MKKALSIFLALVLLCSMLCIPAAAAEPKFEYSVLLTSGGNEVTDLSKLARNSRLDLELDLWRLDAESSHEIWGVQFTVIADGMEPISDTYSSNFSEITHTCQQALLETFYTDNYVWMDLSRECRTVENPMTLRHSFKVTDPARASLQVTYAYVLPGDGAPTDVDPGDPPADVIAVRLNKHELTLNVGDGEKLIATVLPSSALNKAVEWFSSDESVATVDQNGNVKGIKEGTATITVRTVDGHKTDVCVVTVKKSGGDGPIVPPTPSGQATLTYNSNGGTVYEAESYDRGTEVILNKTPSRVYFTFTGWYADPACTQRISTIKMDGNKTVYAGWKQTEIPTELTKEHYAYVVGYENGTVRPEAKITRAEVAAIFFRLLSDEVREQNLTKTNTFSDVSGANWYNTDVSTLSSMGIVHGYTDGRFHGEKNITRAEFAAIAARFDSHGSSGRVSFSDTDGHWAQEEIAIAANNGWILGYEDGTFRPDREINRAEAFAMINRVLQRNPESRTDLLNGMITWPDNSDLSKWYYLDVQEATNSHNYSRRESGYEYWTSITPPRDWSIYN